MRLFAESGQDETASMRLTAGVAAVSAGEQMEYPGFGSGDVPMELEGDDGRIAFATAYLNDALDALSDEVALEFSSATSPAALRQAEDPEGQSYVHIIMPQVVANWE